MNGASENNGEGAHCREKRQERTASVSHVRPEEIPSAEKKACLQKSASTPNVSTARSSQIRKRKQEAGFALVV